QAQHAHQHSQSLTRSSVTLPPDVTVPPDASFTPDVLCSAATTVSASFGPMPGTAAAISSGVAADTAFTEPNALSSAARRAGPRPDTESSADVVTALPRLAR